MRVVVNLTVISRRLRGLPRVLETILGQTRPPDGVRLWISEDPFLFDEGVRESDLPRVVRRLGDAGRIEIRSTPNNGPHRKLIPFLREIAPLPDPPWIATADDDVLYPQRWLEELLAGPERHPEALVCFRAKRIRRGPDGLEPYSMWSRVAPDQEVFGHDLLCTGCAGVLVHRDMFDQRILCPEVGEIAPSRSDAWMGGAYLSKRTPVLKLALSRLFPDPTGLEPEDQEFPNPLLQRRRGLARIILGTRAGRRGGALWAHNQPINDDTLRRAFAFYGVTAGRAPSEG